MCLLQFDIKYQHCIENLAALVNMDGCMCFIQLTAAVTEFDAIFLSDISLYFDSKLNWPAVVC